MRQVGAEGEEGREEKIVSMLNNLKSKNERITSSDYWITS